MKPTRRIIWAGVEFQPDLQNPQKPVRLGVVLLSSSGDSLILGRQPLLDPKPLEFNDVGMMMLELAASWVKNMGKDILEADVKDPLARLLERWRWNLYLIQPAKVGGAAERQGLLALGKQIYERFVGEPFQIHTPTRSHLAPAWLVEEITRRRSSHELAATA